MRPWPPAALALLLAFAPAAARTLDPTLYAQIEAADRALAAQRPANAEQILTRALGQGLDAADRALLLELRARAWLQLERPGRALDDLAAAAASGGLEPAARTRIQHDRIALLLQLGRTADALPLIEPWLAQLATPTPEERMLAAQVYAEADRLAPARTQVEAALAGRTSAPRTWLQFHHALLYRLADHPALIAALERFVARFPDSAAEWRTLASLLLEADRRVDATRVLATAEAAGLLEPRSRLLLASLYLEQRAPSLALPLLEAPGEPDAGLEPRRRELLLHTLLELRDRDATIERLTAWQQQAPEPRWSRLLLSLLIEQERWPDAAAAAETLARFEPTADDWLQIGIARLNAGRRDAAIDAFERARAAGLSPTVVEGWLGYAHATYGR